MRSFFFASLFIACVSDEATPTRLVPTTSDGGSNSSSSSSGGSSGSTSDSGPVDPGCTLNAAKTCCVEWDGPAAVTPFSANGTGQWHDFGGRFWIRPMNETIVFFARTATNAASDPTRIFVADVTKPAEAPVPAQFESVFGPGTSTGWPTLGNDFLIVNSGTLAVGGRNLFRSNLRVNGSGIPFGTGVNAQWTDPGKTIDSPGALEEAADAYLWPMPDGTRALVYSRTINETPQKRRIFLGPENAGGGFDVGSEVPGLAQQGVAQFTPFMLPDGLTVYFAGAPNASNPSDADIFRATRISLTQPFGAPSAVADLSDAAAADFPSWVSKDECRFMFTSNRSGNYRIYERHKKQPAK